MKQDTGGTTTVSLADTIDARIEFDRQMRRRTSGVRAIVGITAAVTAAAAVMLAALSGGNGGSPAACEAAMRTEVRALLAGGDNYDPAKLRACSDMSDAEVDRITGRLLGQAFAG